jgi:hypothetical protein
MNNLLKRSYKHYYAQNTKGEWEEVERSDCVSYDPATAFTGKYPQRWYADFDSGYIVKLCRDAAGERLYNAVRYMRRKEAKMVAEQFGCIGDDCPKCKGWKEDVKGKPKCETCKEQRVVFVPLDCGGAADGSASSLEIASDTDLARQLETSYLMELLHDVLKTFAPDERKLWKCLAADMKKKDVALLFGWTEDKLYYRQSLLYKKLRSDKRLKDFFEVR